MARKSEAPEVYYRFGIAAEAVPLDSERACYSGLVVGANVASWGQSWVAGLLGRTRKPFMIDPMAYVFAQDPASLLKEDELRQSYTQLVESYGGVLPAIAGKRPLKPRDLSNVNSLGAAGRKFVDNVLAYELGAIERGESAQKRISDYLQMLGEAAETPELAPESLVPPYFYATSLEDEWYSVSLQMAEHAASSRKKAEVLPVICLSDRVLADESAARQVVSDYGQFPSVLVWISDLDETKCSREQLIAYGRFVEQLAARGAMPMALYGGYFSLVLSCVGLRRVSSGISYGESKGVSRQATGGGPPLRYYVPRAHAKVVMANAITFYAANPSEFCKCSVCRTMLGKSSARTASARITETLSRYDRELAARHFMRVRAAESRVLSASTRSQSLRSLESDATSMEERNAATLRIPIGQVTKWIEALQQL